MTTLRWPLLGLAVSLTLLHPDRSSAQASPSAAVCWSSTAQSKAPDSLLKALRQQYASDLGAIDIKDKALRKAISDDWAELHTDLLESLENEHFVFGTSMNALLDSIISVLAEADPELRIKPRVLLSWYPWPNATCRGEGTIVMNLGLLERLRTRSELAFVLAHEVAHQHMEHVRTGIETVNAKLLSEEFKDDLRSVLRDEFDRLAKLEKLYISFSVNERRHGRNHETAADSMALRLLERTEFNPRAGITLMDVLEACDDDPYPHVVDLEQPMIAAGADPNGDWLLEEEVSSLGAVDLRDHELEEELSTHPECAIRRRALQALAEDLPRVYHSEDADYAELLHTAQRSMLESAMQEKNMGRAVFVGLHLVAVEPTDPYLHAGLSQAFSELLRRGTAHDISSVLDIPNQRDPKSYIRLLQMLNRLRLGDYRAMANYHLAKAVEYGGQCEETLFASILVARAQKQLVELEAAKTKYLAAFPEGRHSKWVKELNNSKTKR